MNIESVKTFFTAIREAIIVGLFLLVLFFPQHFNDLLNKAGFTEGSLMGFNWEKTKEETVDAAEEVSALNDSLLELQDKLAELQRENSSGQTQSYEEIGADVRALVSKSKTADDKLKSSLIGQQDALKATGKISAAPGGWVGIGLVGESRESWQSEQSKVIAEDFSDVAIGATLTFTKDAYVRAPPDSPTSFRSSGDILTVIRRGNKAEVVDALDFVSLKSGGYSVWAKIEQLP